MNEILCPQCGARQIQDFGIMTCPSCGIVLMADMDGQIQRMDSPTGGAEGTLVMTPPAAETLQDEQVYESPIPKEAPEVQRNQSPELSDGPPDGFLEMIPPEVEPTETPQDVFQEIESFANSSTPSAAPLSYDVLIAEIDRGDLRARVLDVLSDTRLNLDSRELSHLIVKGQLELKGLNAVKASVIVQRLRSVPVKLSWRQHVYQA